VPTIAFWPGRIAPGVTAAMGSHLDILPTFLSLAGAQLPKDRHYDGMDLSPVLFDKAQTLHESLFHGESIGGALTAWRFHQYKAFSKTYAVGSCNSTARDDLAAMAVASGDVDAGEDNGEIHVHLWSTPLIFDLSADPAESKPLKDVDPRLIAKMRQVHAELLANIQGTPHSHVDWTMGWEAVYPCCNPHHVLCRCED
jgi:arylsulfatase A-like enzyme